MFLLEASPGAAYCAQRPFFHFIKNFLYLWKFFRAELYECYE
jgi:hypothetical protein